MKKARSLAKRQRAKRREQRLTSLMGEFLQAERDGKPSLMKMLGKELASFDPADVNACYRAMGRPNAAMPKPHLPSAEPATGVEVSKPGMTRADMEALVARIRDNGLPPGAVTMTRDEAAAMYPMKQEPAGPAPRVTIVGAERDDFHERAPIEDEMLE